MPVQTAVLQDALMWSESLAAQAMGTLDTVSDRLSDMETLLAPITQRTGALRGAREGIKAAVARCEELLSHMEVAQQVEGIILQGPGPDVAPFLDALSRLDTSIAFLSSSRNMPVEAAVATATALKKEGIQRTLQEFASILRRYTNVAAAAGPLPVPPVPSMGTDVGGGVEIARAGRAKSAALPDNLLGSTDDPPPELLPAHAVSRLRSLAATLQECHETGYIKAYCEGLMRVMDKGLQQLSAQPVPQDDLNRATWHVVDRKVQGWVHALHAWARLGVSQHALAHAVFEKPFAVATFNEIMGASVAQLLATGQAIIALKRLPEKIFGLLDMWDALAKALSQVSGLLEGTAGAAVVASLEDLQEAVQKEARAGYLDLEASIGLEFAKTEVQLESTVSPITAQTLTVLKRLMGQPSAVQVVFRDAGQAPNPAHEITRVLQTLSEALVAHSKTFKNKALGAVFLLNNAHYIIKGLEAGSLMSVLGQDRINTNKQLMETALTKYLTMVWNPLMEMVKVEPGELTPDSNKGLSSKQREKIKEQFRAINGALRAVQESQSGWTVADAALRKHLRKAILAMFLPKYKDFFTQYQMVPFTKNPEKYLQYTVSDVQDMITRDLFDGRLELEGGTPAAPTPLSSLRSAIQGAMTSLD